MATGNLTAKLWPSLCLQLLLVLGAAEWGPCSAADSKLGVTMTNEVYTVVFDGKPIFDGHGVAFFNNQRWYTTDAARDSQVPRDTPDTQRRMGEEEERVHMASAVASKLSMAEQKTINGADVIGSFTGVETHWETADGISFVTSANTYPTLGNVVTFSYRIAKGPLVNTNSDNATNVITNFPALSIANSAFGINSQSNATFLSWRGTFINAQNSPKAASGTTSGPHVYINGQAPVDEADVIIMSYFDHFMSSSQTDVRYNGMHADWIPGISQSVTSLPTNFSQTFIIYYGNRGLTQAMYDWGQLMQSTHSPTGKLVRMPDPTLEYLGYQTDNGAMYCFCRGNCIDTLLDEKAYLDSIKVPIQYLSHQGDWWQGGGSPWCIGEWEPNGRYSGMSVSDFQKKFGVPLQLYAPNFCNSSKYAKSNGGKWEMVDANVSLPGCNIFSFKSPSPASAAKFYNWFFQLGISMGMESFEIDFLNQNYNCVPALRESPEAIEMWMLGLHEAAVQQNQPMQWCMATPTNVMASLNYPSVTNFRSSNDYMYGTSYRIGSSSLLLWALGAAPSKDTFWTTDNMPLATKLGGCGAKQGCPPDHSNISLELHTMLALLSTGPVGFSDAINMTNASLIMRTCQQNGTLLKPAKAVTTVDAAFSTSRAPAGSVYGTYCGNSTLAVAFLLVSFSMQESWNVTIADLWSPSAIPRPTGGALPSMPFVYRLRWNHPVCVHNKPASQCVQIVELKEDVTSSTVLEIPPQIDSKEHHLAPCLTTVWPVFCPNGWVLLGELSKYVPLAESRFPAFYRCTEAGLSTTVRGEPGEVVSVTALGPDGDSAAGMAYVKNVTIDKTGLVSLTFE